jgi:hypothetical protein
MTTKKPRKLHLILNDLATTAAQDFPNRFQDELINHPQMKDYSLDIHAVRVISHLWQREWTVRKPETRLQELVRVVNEPEWSINHHLTYLSALMDRNIINVTEVLTDDYHLFPVQLLSSNFRLCSSFSYLIMDVSLQDFIKEHLDYRPFTEDGTEHFLNRTFSLMRKYHWEAETKLIRDIDFTYPDYYQDFIAPIINIFRFGMDISITRAIRKSKLNQREIAILIYVVYQYFNDAVGHPRSDLVRLISTNPAEEKDNITLLEARGRLLSSGILSEDDDEITLSRGWFTPRPEVDDLFDATDYQLMQEAEEKPEGTNIALRKMHNPQTLDKLILPQSDMSLIQAAMKRFHRGNSADLGQWGINPPGYEQKKRGKGLNVLFYGEPGTGKTFAAGAIARELGKDLLAIDAAQLRNKWYGNTEKLVREIFGDMKKTVQESKNPPVFLLNEADQIIHKRDLNPVGADNTENAIQNIILEELEQFPGILIMTTNLLENIDDAYFRRFDIKLVFTLPDQECRERLWQAHLLPTIPGADSIPYQRLARDYNFTGGQIALVIQNACAEAIAREGDDKVLKLQDILKYAALEQPWAGKGKKHSVGFKSAL